MVFLSLLLDAAKRHNLHFCVMPIRVCQCKYALKRLPQTTTTAAVLQASLGLQAVASRPDLIPPSYISELEKLQDQIPPFPTDAAMVVIAEELGPPPAFFSSLSPEPIAAASLGQVNLELRSGWQYGAYMLNIAGSPPALGLVQRLPSSIVLHSVLHGIRVARHIHCCMYFMQISTCQWLARSTCYSVKWVVLCNPLGKDKQCVQGCTHKAAGKLVTCKSESTLP